MESLPTPVFIARGSPGLYFAKGPKCEPFSACAGENYSDVRGVEFSSDGSRMAWVTSQCVKVAETTTWEVILEVAIAKVGAVKFSPTGRYLGVWHPFFVSKENPQGGPNMYVYDVDKKECIKSLIHKKYQSWEIQWTPDDAVCARNVSNEVHFFENGQLDSVAHKLRVEGLTEYSMAPSNRNPHVAVFIPSVGGRPAGARMFKYPNFAEDAAVGRKSFFNANSVEMKWNSRGNTCLLLTSTDVDKTGQSYYGETSIYVLDTKGATAHLQPGGKKGPVYAFEWSPLGTEFCLVYGFMPAKATLYNTKAEPVFEFEPAHRNAAYYNPQGNLLALTGFGNLRGKMEVWDMETRRLVAAGDCPDTTEMRWCPDGRHFTVATCAPRLRQGNGFRVWHYTMQMIYEKAMAEKHELYETYWQPFPKDTFPKPVVGAEKVKGAVKPSQPPPAKAAYVPPNMRGLSKTGVPERKKMLPPGMSEPEPEKKTKSKNKKKGGGDGPKPEVSKPQASPTVEDEPFVPPSSADRTPAPAPASSQSGQTNVERKKKRETLKKKLKDIAKLKSDQAAGKEMNAEQLEKISREAELTRELQELTV